MYNREPSCILVDTEGSESEYPIYKETFNFELTPAISMRANIYHLAGENICSAQEKQRLIKNDAIKCLTRNKRVKKCFRRIRERCTENAEKGLAHSQFIRYQIRTLFLSKQRCNTNWPFFLLKQYLGSDETKGFVWRKLDIAFDMNTATVSFKYSNLNIQWSLTWTLQWSL